MAVAVAGCVVFDDLPALLVAGILPPGVLAGFQCRLRLELKVCVVVAWWLPLV